MSKDKQPINGQALDLASLDTAKGAEAGFELTLRHPTEDTPTHAVIELVGMDSATYRKKSRELQRMRAAEIARSRKLRINIDETEEDALEVLVACTRGWKNISLGGQALECNSGNARRLYKEFPWVREQVDRAIHDRANFLQASSSS